MTRTIVIVYIAVALCVFAQGQGATPSSKPESEVAQVERDWLAADAKGDAAVLRKIIADDFIGTSFDGHVLGKEDIIPQGGGRGGFAGARAEETSVRVFGDTGILMGSIKTAPTNQAESTRVA